VSAAEKTVEELAGVTMYPQLVDLRDQLQDELTMLGFQDGPTWYQLADLGETLLSGAVEQIERPDRERAHDLARHVRDIAGAIARRLEDGAKAA
jgi:hypothetical protein